MDEDVFDDNCDEYGCPYSDALVVKEDMLADLFFEDPNLESEPIKEQQNDAVEVQE